MVRSFCACGELGWHLSAPVCDVSRRLLQSLQRSEVEHLPQQAQWVTSNAKLLQVNFCQMEHSASAAKDEQVQLNISIPCISETANQLLVLAMLYMLLFKL